MRFSHFFIDRPIFAAVLSIVIVIGGALAYRSLPVSQYPDVVPPTVVVTANYPGASPAVIAETVATPIEQEVNGVEDMLYMSSQSTSDGRMTLTITFRLGTNLDQAQVLVQNRVAIAEPRLPEDVRRLGITTRKSSPDLLMVVHLLSPRELYDQLYIGNYALLHVRDVLARLDGVGDVTVFGLREYSMRVWLEPERLDFLGLTPGDVVRALREQNVQVAAGVIGQPPVPSGSAYQLNVNALGRLLEPAEFENIIVKTGADGRITRLRSVARIELAARDYSVNSYLDNQPAVAIVVFQRPGSNALATAEAIEGTMNELAEHFPEGLEHRIVYNPTLFIRESVDAVIETLFEAVALVVLVVLVFLQTWRAAVIPLAAIPVSLVGTFGLMAAFGFSLNTLSLFGLVLAIGIVVDDAIVVVENVERHIAAGLAPRDATRRAMDEVTGAVVAIAVGLSAVFVPTAFLGGITGQFYRQFALTIAASTILSAFNSLTLSPALAALLLQPHDARNDWFARLWDRALGWFFRGFNRVFERGAEMYGAAVARVVRHGAFGLTVYGGLITLTLVGFGAMPTGFIPQQDRGYLITAIQLPDGASLERTDAVMRRATELILETPGVRSAVAFVGFSGATRTSSSNTGAIFVGLDPFEERAGHDLAGGAILAQLQRKLFAIQEGMLFVIPPPEVQGLGTAGGFKLLVQDRAARGHHALQEVTDGLVEAARGDRGLAGVFTPFRSSTPQLYADIDRVKAQKIGVPIGNIFEALQTYLGSVYVNDLNLFGRTYQVTAQAAGSSRAEPSDILKLKTRGRAGEMVPLGSVLDIEWRTAPERILRHNMYPAAEIQGDAAPGFSVGEAMATMERLAARVLPAGMAIEWTDLAYQARLAGNAALFIFPLCVLFVFLTHSAEYESWSLALAIILIAPLSLLFALTGVWLRGMDNNLITQIGFVVLVGLAAKNAVLIVEFAKQQEEAGKDRFAAAVEACRLRLRPILMTSFAFILGVLPLVTSEGAGAETRRVLGTAVFSGMLGVTFFGLFLTPIFYVVLRGLSARRRVAPTHGTPPPHGSAGRTTSSLHGRTALGLVVAASLLMAGCMLAGRDYRAPDTAVPPTFANEEHAGLSTADVETRWWSGFGDERLERLVGLATRRNHDLRIAFARLLEARALRLETQLDLAPTITASGGYANQRTSEASFPGGGAASGAPIDRDRELYDAGFDASWEIDFFGRVRRAVEARRADEEAAEAALHDVLVSLQAEVARNYVELRGTQNRLAVAERNAANQRATFDLTRARLEGGRGTELDTSRARAQLNATLAGIPPLEAAIRRAIHRLSVLVAEPPAALESELSEPAPLPDGPALVSLGSPGDLLRRRPDVASAERSLAASTARLGVAVGDLFPRVTFVGSVALEADALDGLGKSGADSFSFGPRIFWAAFDLGRVRARIQAADARTEAALAAYERSVLTALEDTENALVDLGTERRRRDFLRDAAEASERAVALARDRYEYGVSDFLTVLDAERTLLEAQDRLAESETRSTTALVAVYKALAGGWESADADVDAAPIR